MRPCVLLRRPAVALLLTAAAALPASAQQAWQRQYPATFPDLLDVAANGAGLVVAVGDDGQVLRSLDDGASWTATTVTPGTPAGRLAAVEFLGGTLLAGGDGLFQSVDGGVSWSFVDPTLQIQDIETIGASHAWAITADGKVLRSSDGGGTWATSLLPQAQFFGLAEAIEFKDTLDGWASARNGQMFATLDGGATWTLFNSPTNWTLFAMQRSATVSYLMEDSEVWRGGPNGGGWSSGYFPWVANARDFQMVGSFGIVVGLSGRIHYTPNSGANWVLSHEDGGFEHQGVVVLDPQRAIVVGEQGRVLRTTDGANSWTVVHGGGASPTSYWIWGMDAVQNDLVFAACNSGRILRSDDRGATWTEQDGGSVQTLYRSVSFFDGQHGYAVGEKQGFYPTFSSTHDGGLNWFEVNQLGMYDIYDIEATGPMTAYAASETRIWYTVNGGQNWNSHTPQPYGTYHAIDFVGDYGWAAGTQVVQTTDGGLSWQWTYDPTPRIYGLDFIDPQKGWMVGEGGAILRTTNGGQTWVPQNSGVTTTLNTVTAITDSLVSVAGEQGVVLLSNDGGQTWASIAPAGLSQDSVTASVALSGALWIGGYGAAGIWRLSSSTNSCVNENYCTGKTNSAGGVARMRLFGGPSVSNGIIGVGVVGALSNTVGLGFKSEVGEAAIPVWNGTLCVQGPLTRMPPVAFDVNGFAYYTVPMDPAWVGTSHWYQFFYRDPANIDGTGIGMSDGLHLTFCP